MQKSRTKVDVHVCIHAAERAYLGEVEEVCVWGGAEGVDGSSEGVDLLVGVAHQHLGTALGQQHVHDGCSDTRRQMRSKCRETNYDNNNTNKIKTFTVKPKLYFCAVLNL